MNLNKIKDGHFPMKVDSKEKLLDIKTSLKEVSEEIERALETGIGSISEWNSVKGELSDLHQKVCSYQVELSSN